ncbi:PREDICTED: phospholipase A1 2-like [Polistes dominula]|uniref:phospholipase A1 n=1 Tax=Polistes dominula TaxID=743375 RepID=A0ABM1J3Z7_POLDO|nr:PREDICTED: phospholipase A1 2-like [Polistes dominula]
MILQYFILLACFTGVLHNCYADDDKSSHNNNLSHLKLSEKQVIPDCYFGVDTLSFILFTRKDKDGINLTIKNLTSSHIFRKDELIHPVIILIHGFISSANNSNYEDLANVLLEKEDLIVISVDWKEGACNGGLSVLEYAGYFKAVKNTRAVGQYVANFTKILVDNYEVPMKKIQIIGHSLGAHIAGFAGKEVQKLNMGKYHRITGLDPAGPAFADKDCSNRLCKTDAEYVQVLHTTTLIGSDKRFGNIDFYINKGYLQPSCQNSLNLIKDATCSHSRAVEYLTNCLKYKCCLVGIPWDYSNYRIPLSKCTKKTCVCIALNTENYPADGSFYVPVKAKYPYCYNKGIKF